METHEAENLAVKMNQSWPKGPPVEDWVDVLADLDPGRVGTAYARLRRTAKWAPTVPDFIAEYRAVRTGGPEEDKCPDCSDGGWVPSLDYWNHGVEYTSAMPCSRCKHGKVAEASDIWKYRKRLDRAA